MSFPRGPVAASAALDGVSPANYARLLGYPAGRELEGAILTLATESRGWFRGNARPWWFARRLDIERIEPGEVALEGGAVLSSRVLARRLRRAEAEAVVVAAVSAGPEVDARSAALWAEDRPDEGFFLDRLGAAVAEHLAAACGAALRRAEGEAGLAALPGYSPGHNGWDLTQQTAVHELLTAGGEALPGPLTVFESGSLAPKNSLLAVFGLAARHDLVEQAWATGRCGWCSLKSCDFRETPASTTRPRAAGPDGRRPA